MRKDTMNKVNITKKSSPIVTLFCESTTKDLLSLQAEYMLKQLDSALLKSRMLNQIESSKGNINRQINYFENLGNELSEITGKEIGFLKSYKNKLIDIVENNMTAVPFMSASYRATERERVSVVNLQKK